MLEIHHMISVNNILGHYSPKQIETLIIHEHADINKYISQCQNFDQVVLNKTGHTVTFFTSKSCLLLDLKVVILRF